MVDLNSLLRENKFRVTSQRKIVLEALDFTPLSVEDIFGRIQNKKLKIDRVSIYRALECFVSLGIVGKVNFQNNEAKFELLSPTSHHHHLVCQCCGKIEDLSIDEEPMLSKIKKSSKFKVLSHSMEFFGLCQKCH